MPTDDNRHARMETPRRKASFRESLPPAWRAAESRRILQKYPGRVPVVVEAAPTCDLTLDRRKFLVPRTLTFGQFIYVVRKRIRLQAERALFMFLDDGGVLPPTSSLVGLLYDAYKSEEDGFLYVTFAGENTFGALPRKTKHGGIETWGNRNFE